LVIGLVVGGAAALLHRAMGADAEASKGEVPPVPAAGAAPGQKAANGFPGKDSKEADAGERSFVIQCKLTELDKDGNSTTLSQPKVVTLEGQPARVLVGQAWPLPGRKDGKIEYMDIGMFLEVTVHGHNDGKLGVDITTHINEPVISGAEKTVIKDRGAHCVALIQPGDTVEFEFAQGSGGERCRGVFTVVEHKKEAAPCGAEGKTIAWPPQAAAAAAAPAQKAAPIPAQDNTKAAEGGRRCFAINCHVAEVAEDGTIRTLCLPKVVTLAGQPARFLSGPTLVLPEWQVGNIDYATCGVRMDVTVHCQKDGRLLVDIAAHHSEPVANSADKVVIGDQGARCTALIQSGDTVEFEFGKSNAGGRYRGSFTVNEQNAAP
jgi:Flp pilus assembly secretin CpaC